MLISELGASAWEQGCCHAFESTFSCPASHEVGLPGMVAARLGIGGHLKAVSILWGGRRTAISGFVMAAL